jgi:hypothetical protein
MDVKEFENKVEAINGFCKLTDEIIPKDLPYKSLLREAKLNNYIQQAKQVLDKWKLKCSHIDQITLVYVRQMIMYYAIANHRIDKVQTEYYQELKKIHDLLMPWKDNSSTTKITIHKGKDKAVITSPGMLNLFTEAIKTEYINYFAELKEYYENNPRPKIELTDKKNTIRKLFIQSTKPLYDILNQENPEAEGKSVLYPFLKDYLVVFGVGKDDKSFFPNFEQYYSELNP